MVFSAINLDFTPQPGASLDAFAAFERKTGILLDEHLKALWQLGNGSTNAPWFVLAHV
jgi:hypothetical protein